MINLSTLLDKASMKTYETLYDATYKKYKKAKESKSTKDLLMDKSGVGIGFLEIGLGGYIFYHLANSPDASIPAAILPTAFVIGGLGSITHFYQSKKLTERFLRKKQGEVVTEEEIPKIKKREKIGRTAHRIGAAATYGAAGYLMSLIDTFEGAIFVGLASLVYKENIWKGYKGIYAATVDSIIGERGINDKTQSKIS